MIGKFLDYNISFSELDLKRKQIELEPKMRKLLKKMGEDLDAEIEKALIKWRKGAHE